MFIKFNSVELDNTVANNRLKKFYICEANSIKDFVYPASKILNAVNIKKPWYLINSKDKSIENNN